MAFKIKLSQIPFIQVIGVCAPALAIFGFLTVLGGVVPLCVWDYHTILGNRPLPGITHALLSMVSALPIPLHWIGLAAMLALPAAAYMIARGAPSTETALKRLLLLISTEWCALFFFIAVSALALALPVLPVFEAGENLDTAVLPRFIDSFAQSKSAVIYEGLPSPNLERDLFESEKHSKPALKMHGFYFYKTPVNLSPEDEAALQSMMVTAPPFISWTGEKQCMGYHPDFAIEWHDEAGHLYDALICFGCGEAKLYGPGIQLYCDDGGPSYKTFKELLLKYHKDRP